MTAGILPRAAWRFRPWRNGGGETAELAVAPPGAEVDRFDWRVSAARIDRSGPFSAFPGVDRALTVIEGGAIELSLAGRVHRLDPAAAPFVFAGDAPCTAELVGPAALVLNVMTRRPRRAEIRRERIGAGPQRGRRLALLLAEAAGLSRLDLVDLGAAAPGLAAALAGAEAILIGIGD